MTNQAVSADGAKAAGDVAKEFLLAEYSKYQEAFAKNEELGERRVQFFLGLVTAAAGAVILLSTAERGAISRYPIYIPRIAFGLATLLLAVGFLTYDRLLKRDETTAEYQSLLDQVRSRFIDAARTSTGLISLEGYIPFPQEKPKLLKRMGRLGQLILVINAWMAGVAAVLLRCSFTGWPNQPQEALVVASLAISTAAAAFISQWAWWKAKYFASN